MADSRPADRPVRAVIFDWGGTLTPWHTVDIEQGWRAYVDHYTRLGPGADEAAVGAETAEGAEGAEGDDARADRRRRADALRAAILAEERRSWALSQQDGTSARMSQMLAAAGVRTDHPGHTAAQAAYEEFWEPHTFTDPDVRPLFTGLRRRGVRVGVLSNTIWSAGYHDAVFARDGVLELIDGAVYSSQIEHAKPHREAFRAAVTAVGMSDPADCVYVGDRPYEDVHGAQRAGLRAVLVPHSDIPLDQQVPVQVHPDAVVQRLIEVLDLVDRWNSAQPGGRA